MKQLAARERKARIEAYLKYLKSRPAAPTSPPRVIATAIHGSITRNLLTGGGVIDHLAEISGVKILNAAHYGDSVQQMLGVAKRRRIEALFKKPGFDILLFSGGGNDIAGDQFCLWLKPNTGGGAASAVDTGRLQEILGVVEDGYRDLIEIRDRCAPDCWIVTHAYDFPQPGDRGVCGLGPCLSRRWIIAAGRRTPTSSPSRKSSCQNSTTCSSCWRRNKRRRANIFCTSARRERSIPHGLGERNPSERRRLHEDCQGVFHGVERNQQRFPEISVTVPVSEPSPAGHLLPRIFEDFAFARRQAVNAVRGDFFKDGITSDFKNLSVSISSVGLSAAECQSAFSRRAWRQIRAARSVGRETSSPAIGLG